MEQTYIVDKIRKILRQTILLVTWVGGFSLIFLVVVTFVNVIGRYVFKKPLQGAVEISQLLLAITVFFAIPYTEVRKQHVTFDEIVNRFPIRLKALILGIMYFMVALFAFILGWQETLLAISYCIPRVRVTDVLKLPIAPVMFVIALGAFLWGIELVLNSLTPIASSEKEDVIKQEGIKIESKSEAEVFSKE